MRMHAVVLSCGLVLMSARVGNAADDPTAELLEASRPKSNVVLRLVDDIAKQKIAKTPFEFSDDAGASFSALASGQAFAIRKTVKVEFDSPNPFSLQLSAAENLTDDPNNAQLAKFVDKLLSFPTAIGQKQGSVATGCQTLDDFYAHLETLRTQLRAGVDNAAHLELWRETVDNTSGRTGILNAQKLVKERLATLKLARKNAAAELAWIEALAATTLTASTPTPPPASIPLPNPSSAPTSAGATTPVVPASKGSGKAATGALQPAPPPSPAPTPMPTPAALADACLAPGTVANALARIVDIGSAREGLKNLDQLIDAVTGIGSVLDIYATKNRWNGNYYLLHEVSPSFASITTVTVKATRIKYSATPEGLAVQIDDSSASTALVFRGHSSLIPELAAGMVISRIVAPEYGTTTNAAGQLVVSAPVNKATDYSPALMLNAVCRCRLHSFAYPMLQLGVAADAAAPALLFGGGFRFTRSKKLALSAGVIIAWFKELKTLHPGSPVKGTADIRDDLAFKNVNKGYIALLYKF
jgi:hypothetical protein